MRKVKSYKYAEHQNDLKKRNDERAIMQKESRWKPLTSCNSEKLTSSRAPSKLWGPARLRLSCICIFGVVRSHLLFVTGLTRFRLSNHTLLMSLLWWFEWEWPSMAHILEDSHQEVVQLRGINIWGLAGGSVSPGTGFEVQKLKPSQVSPPSGCLRMKTFAAPCLPAYQYASCHDNND